LGKIGITIRNIHFSKKILCFLSQFHRNGQEQGVQTQKTSKILDKIKNDEKYRRKVIDHLLIMIDRYLTEQKAVRLARLFKQFVEDKFDWDTFVYFSVCLDSMHDLDFDLLDFLLTRSSAVVEQISIPCFDKYLLLSSVERLKSFGFVGTDEPTWVNIGDDFKKKIFLSSLGTIFAKGCISSAIN